MTPGVVAAGVLGLCVGSFLNVCIHRLPRRESLLFPASRCPACESRLGPAELLPVVSYLWLKGRCRHCRAAIAPRYPLVELLTATGYASVVAAWGLGLQALGGMALLSVLVVALFTDLEAGIIPNRLTLAGFAMGLALLALRPERFLPGLGGMAAGGGLLLFLSLASRGGMGLGDVKLGGVMGLFLGWPAIAVALAVAFLAGGGVGLALLLSRRKGRREPIPFGPFLVLGAVTAMFWGRAILSWYLGSVGR
ncbi:MAG: prepilin peptidase [bacterium]|nr:prepilin peptidase [bacterium]